MLKKGLVDVKAKITETWKLSKRHGDGLRGLEVILQIRRLGGNFAGLMVALHPPSLLDLKSYILIGLDERWFIYHIFNI